MSTATKIDGMAYERTGKKEASKSTGKKTALRIADQVGTPTLVWLLVKRHKVALLAIGNIVLLLNWIFPEWPQMVLGLIGK